MNAYILDSRNNVTGTVETDLTRARIADLLTPEGQLVNAIDVRVSRSKAAARKASRMDDVLPHYVAFDHAFVRSDVVRDFESRAEREAEREARSKADEEARRDAQITSWMRRKEQFQAYIAARLADL